MINERLFTLDVAVAGHVVAEDHRVFLVVVRDAEPDAFFGEQTCDELEIGLAVLDDPLSLGVVPRQLLLDVDDARFLEDLRHQRGHVDILILRAVGATRKTPELRRNRQHEPQVAGFVDVPLGFHDEAVEVPNRPAVAQLEGDVGERADDVFRAPPVAAVAHFDVETRDLRELLVQRERDDVDVLTVDREGRLDGVGLVGHQPEPNLSEAPILMIVAPLIAIFEPLIVIGPPPSLKSEPPPRNAPTAPISVIIGALTV